MPDVQEVFRMSTQKVRQDPGALERQERRQRRRSSRRKAATIAVAAAIVVTSVALAIGAAVDGSGHVPAGEPTFTASPNTLTLSDLAGTWYERSGKHSWVLTISPDGTYALDGSWGPDTRPDDTGTVAIVESVDVDLAWIRFVSGPRTHDCSAGDVWEWRETELEGGVMHVTYVRAECRNRPLATATWVQAGHRSGRAP